MDRGEMAEKDFPKGTGREWFISFKVGGNHRLHRGRMCEPIVERRSPWKRLFPEGEEWKSLFSGGGR